MPFYLREVDVARRVAGCRSVLIVICRFCPAASVAARHGRTWLEPLRRGLNTESFEEHVRALVSRLRERGVETEVMRGGLRNLVVCMWTAAQREKLRERAAGHDAVVVMGCRGALESIERMVRSTGCRVVQGMEDEAILGVTPRFRFPFRITLDPFALTPLVAGAEPGAATSDPAACRRSTSRPSGGEAPTRPRSRSCPARCT